ncbi:MAG: hypothetical protein CVV25_13260 [Ignavibacteriae bacterium HGW-Ignavibacteriae-4]|jgi:hypothetical protein|nr:MAG: hypothetical protein CVV25_13260 [Ignavibacteriae bacterium HGW-Ignavibacteriae-4]
MEISKDTQNVVDTVESFTNKQLQKKNDFSVIMELAVSNLLIDEYSQAVFNGTAFFKLSRKLNKIDPNDESAKNFKVEFESYLEQFKTNIQTIAEKLEDDKLVDRFETTYFQLTRGCVLNLIDLAHDFAIFKEMQTSNKEGKE